MCCICHFAVVVSSIKWYSYKTMVRGYRPAREDSVPFSLSFLEGNTESNVKHLVSEVIYFKRYILP